MIFADVYFPRVSRWSACSIRRRGEEGNREERREICDCGVVLISFCDDVGKKGTYLC